MTDSEYDGNYLNMKKECQIYMSNISYNMSAFKLLKHEDLWLKDFQNITFSELSESIN